MSLTIDQQRARFRPVGQQPVAQDAKLAFEAYAWEVPDAYRVMVFAGRSIKPALNFRYPLDADGLARRDARLRAFQEALAQKEAAKQAKRDAAAAWQHNLQVGDIFRASWGWEQTNQDYYEVVRLVGKRSVELRELKQQREHTGDMRGTCVPLPGQFADDVAFLRRVSKGCDDQPIVRINNSALGCLETYSMVCGVKCFTPSHWTSYA